MMNRGETKEQQIRPNRLVFVLTFRSEREAAGAKLGEVWRGSIRQLMPADPANRLDWFEQLVDVAPLLKRRLLDAGIGVDECPGKGDTWEN